jgi:hypothetical protein
MVVIGVGTLVLIGMIAWPMLVGYFAKDWPQAEAEVLEGKVVTTVPGGDGPRIPQETVDIRYKYTVDGKEYVGTRFTPDGNIAPDNDGLQVIRTIKIGGKYPIRYNPSNPAESHFYHNYKEPEPVLWVCSGCPTVFAIGLIAYGVAMRRRNRPAAPPPTANPAPGE